jgi:SAM-dependent methyltransferase
MATKAIINFGIKNKNLFTGPALEIGSLINPSYHQELPKSINPEISEYIGIDIFDGPAVDRVVNLCKDEELPSEWIKDGGYFKTVHCHCVLEHVPDVFSMARNIGRITMPGGVVYISVPFVWRLHRIPVDMWRFTPQSIDYLFPLFDFKKEHCGYSTRRLDYYPLDECPEMNLGSGLETRNVAFSSTLKILRRLNLDHGMFKHRALFPEINLMMIGIKKEKPTYSFVDSKFLG